GKLYNAIKPMRRKRPCSKRIQRARHGESGRRVAAVMGRRGPGERGKPPVAWDGCLPLQGRGVLAPRERLCAEAGQTRWHRRMECFDPVLVVKHGDGSFCCMARSAQKRGGPFLLGAAPTQERSLTHDTH